MICCDYLAFLIHNCFFLIFECLKEAFVKALGVGLTIDISKVEFNLDGPSPICNFPGIDTRKWTFEEHVLPDNHVVAVAWYFNQEITPINQAEASHVIIEIYFNNSFKFC